MRERYAVVPLTGKGTDDDPYRPDVPAGLSYAASIPTDDAGHPIPDMALVHLWAGDDVLGELDASGVVFDRRDTRLDELPAGARRRQREGLAGAGRPTTVGSGALVRHLIREGGRVLEPRFHERNLRVSVPPLEGGAPLTDTFTNTAGTFLSSHTSDSGHSWTRHVGFSSSVNTPLISDANRARVGASDGSGVAYASYVPPNPEYDVNFDVTFFSSVPCFAGVVARTADTGTDTQYRAYFRPDLNEANVAKVVAGTLTALGTYAATGATYTGNTFEVRNAAKKFYVAGTERVSTSDNAITSAGKVGVYLYQSTNSTGIHLDNLSVREIATPTQRRRPLGLYIR